MTTSEYKKMITAIFAANTHRGFADWRQCGSLEMEIADFMETARAELADEGRYSDLFDVANKAFLKWADTDKDDSNGETQDFCACIMDIWNEVYNKGKDDISHDKMMKFYIDHLDGSVVDYMMDYLYEFLLSHFKTKDELIVKEQFFKAQMDRLKLEVQENEIRKYTLNVVEDYYIRVLGDMKRPIEEIRDFARQSGSYGIVDALAEIETEYGNYGEALAIYEKRIEERPDSYWSNEPRKKIMAIYKKTGDVDAYNHTLYEMMMANIGSTEYFKEYKALFSSEEWSAEWARLLDIIQTRRQSPCAWYEIEGRFDLIMDCAEPDNAGLIDSYKQLKKLYPERCLQVLINDANNVVKRSKNRRDYRWVANTLKKIQKYDGGVEVAHELAQKYVAEYPRRTALIDELKRF